MIFVVHDFQTFVYLPNGWEFQILPKDEDRSQQ